MTCGSVIEQLQARESSQMLSISRRFDIGDVFRAVTESVIVCTLRGGK